jgi:hypothetical protein
MPLDDANWPSSETEADEATALLTTARALVARGWCRGGSASDLFGFRVSPYSRRTVARCAGGALEAAAIVASDLDQRRAHCRLHAAITVTYEASDGTSGVVVQDVSLYDCGA